MEICNQCSTIQDCFKTSYYRHKEVDFKSLNFENINAVLTTNILPTHIYMTENSTRTMHFTFYNSSVNMKFWITLFFLGCLIIPMEGRVQQMSACMAKVDNRIINLEPLQRLDGLPRLKTEVENTTYYYNPCVSFNVPSDDPHKGGGDHCYFVAMCKGITEQTTAGLPNYYTLGIQSTAKFMIKPFNSVKIPNQILTIFKETYPGFSTIHHGTDKINKQILDKHKLDKSNENVLRIDEDSHENFDTDTEGNVTDKKIMHIKERSNDLVSQTSSSKSDSNSTSAESPEDGGYSSFSSSEELLTKITYISFKGLRTYKNNKVFIYLLCDHKRQKPEDAVFDLIDIPENPDKHFVLQHQCSCPDGCPRFGSYPYYSESKEHGQYGNETDEKLQSMNKSDSLPKHMWLIVVINGGILTLAVLIGGVFCRKGGSGTGAYYNMLPVVFQGDFSRTRSERSAIHSSHLTIGASAESLFMVKSKLHRPEYLEYSSALTKATQLPTTSDGQIDSRDLEIGQRLGGGLFGDTYLAEWQDRKVAAKRVTVNIHQNQMTEDDHQWICKELVYLSKQKHKHLVAYMGICADMKQPYIITECFEGECLKDMIKRQNENEGMSWPKKIKLCLQIADGLAFLHSAKFPILHRDLRCANVMVDQNDRVKVVDYGLTKIVQRLRQKCNGRKGCFCNKDMSAVPGSVRWTAPEVLAFPTADEYNHFDILTTACDVYSYAMVLWEVATSLDPFEDIPNVHEVIDIVISGGRPPLDTVIGIPLYIQDLMKKCWSHDPDNRPTFKNVAVQMKSSLTVASKDKRMRTTSTTSQYMKSLLSTHMD